jgi:hypothetical protein
MSMTCGSLNGAACPWMRSFKCPRPCEQTAFSEACLPMVMAVRLAGRIDDCPVDIAPEACAAYWLKWAAEVES